MKTQFIAPKQMFIKKNSWFGKFRTNEYDITCLYILEKMPIKLFGEWYLIKWMK